MNAKVSYLILCFSKIINLLKGKKCYEFISKLIFTETFIEK